MLSSKGWRYIDLDKVTANRSIINKFKVMMSKTSAEHAGQSDSSGRKKVISRIGILKPGEICTESYLVIGSYDDEQEALNMVSYMKTCFVRFLLGSILLTQNIAKDKFSLIPLQDFTHSWSDADLYAKYGLTDEEIKFIESTIKPMK